MQRAAQSRWSMMLGATMAINRSTSSNVSSSPRFRSPSPLRVTKRSKYPSFTSSLSRLLEGKRLWRSWRLLPKNRQGSRRRPSTSRLGSLSPRRRARLATPRPSSIPDRIGRAASGPTKRKLRQRNGSPTITETGAVSGALPKARPNRRQSSRVAFHRSRRPRSSTPRMPPARGRRVSNRRKFRHHRSAAVLSRRLPTSRPLPRSPAHDPLFFLQPINPSPALRGVGSPVSRLHTAPLP